MTDAPDRVPCPLRPCHAVVTVVRERRNVTSAEMVDRLAAHRFQSPGTFADGQVCPASLMLWPLNLAAAAVLAEAEQVMSVTPDAEPCDADLWFGAGRPSGHSLEPHPDTDPRWFRGSTGMGTADYGRWR